MSTRLKLEKVLEHLLAEEETGCNFAIKQTTKPRFDPN